MPDVLIDTDIAIDYLRGSSYVKDLMLSLWDKNKAYISILTVYELYAGMQEKEKEDTDNFISACNIEFITLEIAQKAGELYKAYREKGLTLTAIDCLISATAIINKRKIATRNIEHYPDKELLVKFHR